MNIIQTISIFVSYSQIIVSDSLLDAPFNDWSDQHMAQGFAWRPGFVSFLTVEEAALYEVIIDNEGSELMAAAKRVIDVPFVVPARGRIDIASISDRSGVEIAPGSCQLRFQCLDQKDETPAIRLSFWPERFPVFRVVRADKALRVPTTLLLAASVP